MEKGFLAIVLVFALLPLIFESLEGYRIIEKTNDATKNMMVLRQRINEKTYELEDGFKLTIKKGLEITKLLDVDNDQKAAIICGAISNWADGFKDVDFRVGYVSKNTYKDEFVFGLDSCINFLYIDKEHVEIVEKNQELRYGREVLSDWAVAFIFKFKLYDTEVRVLIPEKTVIK